jgi:hypothetical protein
MIVSCRPVEMPWPTDEATGLIGTFDAGIEGRVKPEKS